MHPGLALFLLCIVVRTHAVTKEEVLTGEDYEEEELHYDYGIVIDCGSSGSRLWIYRWVRVESGSTLPEIRAVTSYKMDKGLANFAENTTELREFIVKMIEPAINEIPEPLQSNTEIFLLATAGMRLLLDDKANDVIAVVRDVLGDSSFSPFKFDPEFGARILSGEEEGLFAWIAVNYLKGTFNKGNQPGLSIGLLELGGASTQIAFVPTGPLLANKYPVRLRGQRYPLYVHSYLHYGLNYVEIWIMERLKEKSFNQTTISNPCLLRGDMFSYESTVYIGSGNPTECRELLENLVYKVPNSRCFPKPCAIGSTYQPKLPLDMKFYVLGGFVPSLKDLKALDASGKFNLEDVEKKTLDYCNKSFMDLMTERPHLKKYLSKTCVAGLYTVLLFNRGYGFPLDYQHFIAAKEIDGEKLSWTMGAILYELVFQFKR